MCFTGTNENNYFITERGGAVVTLSFFICYLPFPNVGLTFLGIYNPICPWVRCL